MVQNAEFTLTGAATTAERQALLCAAHVCDADPAKFSNLAADLGNWRRLAALAARHGLAPLMYKHVRSLGEGVAPSDIEAYLQDQYQASATWNLYLTSHLLQLLGEFEQANIQVLPYKGLVVAEAYYGSRSCRPVGDIDLVVHPKQIDDAMRLLQRLEYTCESKCNYHKTFVRSGVPVELHWRFAPWRFRLPLHFDTLWKQAERVSIADRDIINLSAEDAMILLSTHGARHLWERLIWLVDVAQLINSRPEMSWDTVFERATALGCERIVLLSSRLCEKLLSTKLPISVLDRIRADKQIPVLVAMVEQRLFQVSVDPITQSERDFFGLAVRERMLDRIRFCYPHRSAFTKEQGRFFPSPMRLWAAIMLGMRSDKREWQS